MLLKIAGVLLIILGAFMVLNVLFPLIRSMFGFIWLLIELIIALALGYIGYRLLLKGGRTR